MSKYPLKITFLFSLIVFIGQIATVIMMFCLLIFLHYTGMLNQKRPWLVLMIFAFSSAVVGTILTHFAEKRTIRTIVDINHAAREVAKGNFNITLNEDVPTIELREMTHSFNIMTGELANIEMFRNDFIENVSHEFKTPLAAIEGFATLLQQKNLPENKLLEYTDRIIFNTRRLSALTGNILLLSHLEHSDITPQTETFSLDEQIRQTILMFEEQWTARNLNLDINLDSARYCGSRELLAHVWQNLIGNAIKFASDEGQIRIQLHKYPDRVVTTVSDDGIGMSEEVLRRIYEKFYQGDPSRASGGNGLGLTLAKRIVDLHNGTIQVSSSPGEGSIFTVTLPLSSSPEKSS